MKRHLIRYNDLSLKAITPWEESGLCNNFPQLLQAAVCNHRWPTIVCWAHGKHLYAAAGVAPLKAVLSALKGCVPQSCPAYCLASVLRYQPSYSARRAAGPSECQAQG